ncbi:MAG: PilZ domain-containing protein [Erythrobacter sp.]|uniref:PilZ domain-containing protein n=1 Tax=Erythrobacter sp. TaxID=1042 RepID=UPI0032645B99
MIKKDIITRTSERVPTSADGTCKTDHGYQWDVSFQDLSSGGCRVEDPRGGLGLGSYVSLIIAGTGPHKAEVAWRQGDRVGLEFTRPLPARVLKHLAAEEWDLANDAHATDSSGLPVRRMI